MTTDDQWALYLRLQNMASRAPTSDWGWALDEAMAFVIEEIAAGRLASEAQVNNILTNHAAKHRRRRTLLDGADAAEQVSHNPAEACLEMTARMRRCALRDRLILVELAEGYTAKEVAAEHRVPVGTVKTWAYRARLKFAA